MHSMQFKNALEHKSKRVFIIGSATSAHDIAADHCAQGIGQSVLFGFCQYDILIRPQMLQSSNAALFMS